MHFREMFRKKISPSCEYCEYSFMNDSENICCTKGSDTQKNSCRKFCYDPFKREPRPTPKLPSYSAKDFEI